MRQLRDASWAASTTGPNHATALRHAGVEVALMGVDEGGQSDANVAVRPPKLRMSGLCLDASFSMIYRKLCAEEGGVAALLDPDWLTELLQSFLCSRAWYIDPNGHRCWPFEYFVGVGLYHADNVACDYAFFLGVLMATMGEAGSISASSQCTRSSGDVDAGQSPRCLYDQGRGLGVQGQSSAHCGVPCLRQLPEIKLVAGVVVAIWAGCASTFARPRLDLKPRVELPRDLCDTLEGALRSNSSVGIAGKDSVWIWNLARDCESPYPPQTF